VICLLNLCISVRIIWLILYQTILFDVLMGWWNWIKMNTWMDYTGHCLNWQQGLIVKILHTLLLLLLLLNYASQSNAISDLCHLNRKKSKIFEMHIKVFFVAIKVPWDKGGRRILQVDTTSVGWSYCSWSCSSVLSLGFNWTSFYIHMCFAI
jgi:hypothetical protein